MADFADIASEIEAESVRVALENHKSKRPLISRHFCEECGTVIPEARRAVIRGVTRCVDCQDLHERKNGGCK